MTSSTLRDRFAALMREGLRGGSRQQDLAAALGVSSPTVSRWVTGTGIADSSRWTEIEQHFDWPEGRIATELGLADESSQELDARLDELADRVADVEARLLELLRVLSPSDQAPDYQTADGQRIDVKAATDAAHEHDEHIKALKKLFRQTRVTGAGSGGNAVEVEEETLQQAGRE